MSKFNKEIEHRPCCFCGLSQNNEFEFGKLYDLDDIVTHYYCLLLSSNMQQRGTDDQGILGFLLVDIRKEIRRGKRLICIYCKKNGATLGCCNIKCKRIFHYPCGLRAGTLNQFFGEFRSYCISHRPKQKVDDQVKNELARTRETMCYICFEKVDPCDIVGTIWAPCCKKNAWFHRTCVQQLAISAGYFFKCPLCNDKKLFQNVMLEFGIFIPSQDASWELVPNAFQDLLYRYDQCDAPICLCPKGRKYTSFNAKWELTLCRTCGSQGIHMACGQLKWANPVWECFECIAILGKSAEIPCSSSIRERLQNDSDSDDSDSDISVGKDSPIPFTSTLNIISSTPQMSTAKPRPGPRTYKLKQQAEKEMQQHIKKQAKENICLSSSNSAIKEHNLQSTSDGRIFTNASSCSLTKPSLHDNKNSINLSTEHSQSELFKSAHDVISFSSDHEVIEIENGDSLDDTFIIFDNNTIEKNNIFKSEINMIKFNGSSKFNNLNSLQIETGEQQRTSNQTDTVPFLESNLQKEVESNVENTNSNHENVCRCIDAVSNANINKVVSLVPKEFEDSLATKRKRKNINNEFHNDIVEAHPKRKLKNAPCTSIISHISKSEIIKTEDKQLGETSSSSNMDLYSSTPLTSNNNDLQIIAINERNTSINMSHTSKCIPIHKPKRHVQITKQHVSTNILPTSSVKISLKANTTNTSSENSQYMHITNEQNEIFENFEIDNKTINCDGDAGTNSAIEPRNRSTKTDTRIKSSVKLVRSGPSGSEKAQSSKQWEFLNGIEMTSSTESNNSCCQQKYNNTECDYPRLIPEYIQLQDLKFHVHDINNLQVILYDKFSVNINMEDANTMMMNTNLDISAKKTLHQNTFNSQTEIPGNIKSKNVLESHWSVCERDKSKCTFVSEQLENYKDDVKENVDPITTIPYKSLADSLSTSITSTVDHPSVYVNNNNQYEFENLTRSISSTIENNDERRSHESISLFRSNTSIFDTPINCRNKCVRNKDDEKKDEKDLKPNHIIHGTLEMQSTKIDSEKASYDSTEFVRCTSFSEYDKICKPEDGMVRQHKLGLKVSIDLKRIDDLIHNSLGVLSKDKKRKR